MRIPKKSHQNLEKVLQQLNEAGSISERERDHLLDLVEPAGFDWRRLARYSFLISLICGLIAVAAMLADDWIRSLLEQIFSFSDFWKSVVLFVAGSAVFYGGYRRRLKVPGKVYSTEVIHFIGVALIAGGFGFLAHIWEGHDQVVSWIFLGATLVYGLAGYLVHSTLIWVFALLSLGSWMGAQTGYLSGWGAYYLGMSFPLRFLLLGAALVAGAEFFNVQGWCRRFIHHPSRVIGLLYLFIALWILSLFGNTFGEEGWRRAETLELFGWSVLFAGFAVFFIWVGLRTDQTVYRGFGLTFLFINLYTKFFEHFWESSHKALFFSFLALSFYLIGSRAEAIWELRELKKRVR